MIAMPLPCKIPTGKVHHPLREALPGHIAALSKMQELVLHISISLHIIIMPLHIISMPFDTFWTEALHQQ